MADGLGQIGGNDDVHRDRPFVAPTDVFLVYTPRSSTSWAEMYIRARPLLLLLNRNPSSCSYLSSATGVSDLHTQFVDYYDLTGSKRRNLRAPHILPRGQRVGAGKPYMAINCLKGNSMNQFIDSGYIANRPTGCTTG